MNFLDFFHRLGDKEILWEKRNFGDCKRIFEQAVVEALPAALRLPISGIPMQRSSQLSSL
jgi:hypothetical protein